MPPRKKIEEEEEIARSSKKPLSMNHTFRCSIFSGYAFFAIHGFFRRSRFELVIEAGI